MKTSDKLLIALAITLLIFPTSIILLVAKINRVDLKIYNTILKQEETSDTKTLDFITPYKTNPFTSVRVNGPEFVNVDVKIIPANGYSFKVTNNILKYMKYKIDAAGKLSIDFNYAEPNSKKVYLLIFAPNLQNISFSNLAVDNFNAKGESLTVNLNSVYRFTLNNSTVLTELNLFTNDPKNKYPVVPEINVLNPFIRTLNASVYGSNLQCNECNLDNVNMKIVDSKVAFSGPRKFKKLSINTVGKNMVSFYNITIDSASGNLSNETTIQIPTINLKQILNK